MLNNYLLCMNIVTVFKVIIFFHVFCKVNFPSY